MSEAAAAPAAPAVATPDPALVKRVNDLEDAKQGLEAQVRVLRSSYEQAKSEAASARGAAKPIKDENAELRRRLAESDNLKELARLKAEVSRMHTDRAKRDRELAEEDQKTKARMEDLTRRAIRAEGKFQALESTAQIVVKARDAATAERDQLRADLERTAQKLAESEAREQVLATELRNSTAELRAYKTPAKAK